MMKFLEKFLYYYQGGLGMVMFLEVIQSIIVFTTFTSTGGTKAMMVILFILTLLVLASFIHHAR